MSGALGSSSRARVLGFRVLGFRVLGFRVLGFRVLGSRVSGVCWFRGAGLWVLCQGSGIQRVFWQGPVSSIWHTSKP